MNIFFVNLTSFWCISKCIKNESTLIWIRKYRDAMIKHRSFAPFHFCSFVIASRGVFGLSKTLTYCLTPFNNSIYVGGSRTCYNSRFIFLLLRSHFVKTFNFHKQWIKQILLKIKKLETLFFYNINKRYQLKHPFNFNNIMKNMWMFWYLKQYTL